MLTHDLNMVGKRDTLENRLWSKIEKRSANDCWHWQANKNNKGYGMIRRGNSAQKILAHRAVYELVNGAIPVGLVIMHSCDTPSCCNPSHLRAGTMLENIQDMIKKGRKVVGFNLDNKPPIFSGENHPQAKITNEIAIAIRNSDGNRSELIKKYGVSVSMIKNVRSGRCWNNT